ncbi:Uncharacterized protein cpbgf_100490 [Cryptosporidium parvum]|uniref:Uncharacterized protein n=1 Tax=Cryptosporidium parvum TaxID=5807 RepID=A0A7S7LJY6_CRYPV|nr:Uncharacterized protein CPATCC_0038920 [Cryptosporidium parvum]WRK30438.1 Uncharacterized protein cpbgf_100490 [Cryptosporidium parvum]|eukprot:QOY43582.1 hypothetical protein CPATCC_000383 [Cryptosporidium parvum]
MSEFVLVGSSLFEEKLMEFFNEGVKSKKINKMNALIMKIQKHEFDLSGKFQESDSNGKELLVPKCEIEQKIEIPLDQILATERNSFGVVSTGELFENICQFLRSDDKIRDYKDDFRIILINGAYFSKYLSLIIKYLPTRIDNNQIILFELFKQVYEDILCLISCIPNNIVKETEINKLSELNFKIMVHKNIEKDSKIFKAFNYSSISYDPKSSICQSTRYSPYQYKDIIFKINSLTLSSSSHETISLFMENQLTCVKITITSKTINIIPIRQKFKDITSVLTVPSLYLFNMQNNHNLLINWSPEQSSTKINRVLYTSLLVSFFF